MYSQASVTGCRLCARPAIAWLALLVLAPWMPSPAVAAPKTDVVVLVNGDRITCEIKSLEYNKLKVSTDHMGTVYIEWDKIRSVQTDQYLLLERADGSRAYGQLLASEDGAQLTVRANPSSPPEVVDKAGVVRANPVGRGDFDSRFDGYVSAGLDLSESGDHTSTNLAAGLSSRTQIREWNLDGSATVTDDGEERTERYDLSGASRRLTAGANYYEGMLGFTRNTELDLNVRALAGGGIGRYFVRSNRAEWRAGVGLAVLRENYQGIDPNDSIEAVLGTEFRIFRYDFPETDIGGGLVVLPSLTESGRVRAEGELNVKYEFVDDLYFEFRMYGSYDNDPPLDDAPTSDYGFTTSLGYKW